MASQNFAEYSRELFTAKEMNLCGKRKVFFFGYNELYFVVIDSHEPHGRLTICLDWRNSVGKSVYAKNGYSLNLGSMEFANGVFWGFED